MKQQNIFNSISNDLRAVESELSSIIASRVGLMSDIGNHLLGAGGKRLRPALYFLCANCGQALPKLKITVATAIELIHMATLIHDDIIDDSDTRRGIATANARWGNLAAVLAGDFLFAKAFSLLADAGEVNTLKLLTDTICTICEGEIRQNQDIFDPEQTEDAYISRIGQKTAEFIAISCKLGATMAGLASKDAELLYNYGYCLGIAFQITDDILDITATDEQIGKPAGSDLRQGILTMPVLYALNHSGCKDELKNIILVKDMSNANVDRCLTIIKETCAIEYSYQQVESYLRRAQGSLPDFVVGEVRKDLQEVADFVGLRKY